MNAKLLLVLCLATASISAYLGQEWTKSAASLKVQASKMKADADAAQRNVEALTETLKPDSQPVLLAHATSSTVLAAHANAAAAGVTVNQLTTGQSSGGAGASADLSKMSEVVPGSGLKAVRLSLNGTYSSYSGLLQYVQILQSGPVSVARLKVVGNSFELALRVYGTEAG